MHNKLGYNTVSIIPRSLRVMADQRALRTAMVSGVKSCLRRGGRLYIPLMGFGIRLGKCEILLQDSGFWEVLTSKQRSGASAMTQCLWHHVSLASAPSCKKL